MREFEDRNVPERYFVEVREGTYIQPDEVMAIFESGPSVVIVLRGAPPMKVLGKSKEVMDLLGIPRIDLPSMEDKLMV